MNKRQSPQAPEICPVCGEDVPRNALACRACGADHKSGWRTDADLQDALGESSEDFDYDEYVRKEFGSSIKPRDIHVVWWITAVVLLIALVVVYFVTR